MSRNDERFLMKVVDMYYKEELPQEKIAKQLNVSRTTISRALTKAKKEGYVKIIIDFPAESSIDLEKTLEQKYQLKEVIAVKTKNKEEVDYLAAREAAAYLARVIKNDMTLGITWGFTMKKTVDSFAAGQSPLKVKGVTVVPLLGTMLPEAATDNELRFSYSSLLSSKLAELIPGISYSLPAPLYVQSMNLKEILLKEPQIARTLEQAKKCDLGLFGIGTLSEHSSLAAHNLGDKELLSNLSAQGGIGEIAGCIYDKDGAPLNCELNHKIIGLTLDEIKNIPIRVGVAAGEEKAAAIKTAVAAGLINVLITDSFTAEHILKE